MGICYDIHVYSNSWGSNDNGLTLSGPDQDSLVTEAFFEGVNRYLEEFI